MQIRTAFLLFINSCALSLSLALSCSPLTARALRPTATSIRMCMYVVVVSSNCIPYLQRVFLVLAENMTNIYHRRHFRVYKVIKKIAVIFIYRSYDRKR